MEKIETFKHSLDELITESENSNNGKMIGKAIAHKLMTTYFPWNGLKWKVNSVLDAVVSCDEYDYSDLRSDDIVLDVGACVGGFSLLAAKRVKRVIAVEPLFSDILIENIILNRIQNIAILEAAIGPSNGEVYIRYDPRESLVRMLDFNTLMKQLGHVDFLKFDAEMAEWFLTPSDLAPFRRVEIEIHNFDKLHDYKIFERIVEDAGFEYFTDSLYDGIVHVIHGFK